MIINRLGAVFEHEGVTYTIGGPIVGTDESEYRGLYGAITEIRTEDDKDTENEGPDLYCEFQPPVLPKEIVDLERTFSELYQEPKTLENIILDMVIMAPDMVTPLDDLDKDRKVQVIYAVTEDWAVDGESGHCSELFSDYEDARRMLIDKLSEEMETGCIPQWEENSGFTMNAGSDSYECYLDGEFCENHYSIAVEPRQLRMSEQFLRMLQSYGQDKPMVKPEHANPVYIDSETAKEDGNV
jgi:hypothetical protein